jgi:hypothetical protein
VKDKLDSIYLRYIAVLPISPESTTATFAHDNAVLATVSDATIALQRL